MTFFFRCALRRLYDIQKQTNKQTNPNINKDSQLSLCSSRVFYRFMLVTVKEIE